MFPGPTAEAIAGFRHGVVGMSSPGARTSGLRGGQVSSLRPVRLAGAALGAWTSGLPHSRGGTCHDAPEVATGGLFVLAGAAAACNVELVFVDVPDAKVAAVVPVAAVGLGRLTTMAAAPRTPAVPAPKVRADTQASLLLRASCRGEPGVGELVMVLQSRLGGHCAVGVPGVHVPTLGCAVSRCFL